MTIQEMDAVKEHVRTMLREFLRIDVADNDAAVSAVLEYVERTILETYEHGIEIGRRECEAQHGEG